MSNAVLKAMCSESRLDYYNRCFRIVRGKPSILDLQKTIVCNCYSHSMNNARLFCNRSCASNVIREGVYWTNLMFPCTTLPELDEVVDCFFILTNCMMISDLVKEKYEKFQNWSQQHIETSHRTSDRCERAEEEDHIFTNKTEDLQQEAKSSFYVLYESLLNDFLQSSIYRNHVVEDEPVTNPYYNKQFCNKVMTVIFPKICATWKLMVGDLSRHINRSTSTEESGCYAKRNEKFLKLQEAGLWSRKSCHPTPGNFDYPTPTPTPTPTPDRLRPSAVLVT